MLSCQESAAASRPYYCGARCLQQKALHPHSEEAERVAGARLALGDVGGALAALRTGLDMADLEAAIAVTRAALR